jgi:hypothetical protein
MQKAEARRKSQSETKQSLSRRGDVVRIYHTPKLAPNQISENKVVPLVMSRALRVRASKGERAELQFAHLNSRIR